MKHCVLLQIKLSNLLSLGLANYSIYNKKNRSGMVSEFFSFLHTLAITNFSWSWDWVFFHERFFSRQCRARPQQKLRKNVTKTFHEFDWSISCHLSRLFWTVSTFVVATVLPEAKIRQKMTYCGSIGSDFADLLNNNGWSDNVDSFW